MNSGVRASNTEHPLALGSFRSWVKLLWGSGSFDAHFLPRILFVSLTTLLTSPLRLYENLRYRGVVQATPIHPSPIFIVGHWRTGTTHLHNLMCQDKNLGYVSTFQGMAPGFCLVGEKRIQPLLDKWAQKVHPTRIIDNIPLSFDAPQEEEFAMANTSVQSSLHAFTLPRKAAHFFERYALLRTLSDQELAEWSRTYLSILRKATLRTGGKRLVLKNPTNSGRIRSLLELFPNAKFVHIYRNPYDVFLSTRWLYGTVLPRSQLQETTQDEIDAIILRFYSQLLQGFLVDKALIPAGNLVEVKFEDLELAPLDPLHRLYEELGLPGFGAAEPAFRAYLNSIAGYQRNGYERTAEAINKVNEHWQFALDEWDYARLEPSSATLPAEP